MIEEDLDLTSIAVVKYFQDASGKHGCDWSTTLSAAERTDLHATISCYNTPVVNVEDNVDIVISSLRTAGLRREFTICGWELRSRARPVSPSWNWTRCRCSSRWTACGPGTSARRWTC